MKSRCLAGVAAAWLMLTGASQAATPPWPAAVQRAVDDMASSCRESGGRAGNSPGLVQMADLNGDGVADYVLDEAAYVCGGARSIFGGTGGSSVTVWLGRPGGRAVEAFTHGTFGVKLESSAKGAVLWLAVGGVLCGQQVSDDMPRSAYQSCWRPLQGRRTADKLDFAPVGEIRPR